MTVFPDQAARDYDLRIVGLVPRYMSALEIMAAALAAERPAPSRVLVPGCGTGSEIVLAAGYLPEAHFTALEPSAGMLEAARTKLAAAGLVDRVTFVQGRLTDLDTTRYDAAILSLVLHFVPDNGDKQAFLREIAIRLQPGAPLVVFDPQLEPEQEDALLRWLSGQGHAVAAANAIVSRARTQWHCVTSARLAELLESAGFLTPRQIFKALNYVATFATRADTS